MFGGKSCDFKVGAGRCGQKVEMYHRGMMASVDQLVVRDPTGVVHVVYLCPDHAGRLLFDALGEGIPPSPRT